MEHSLSYNVAMILGYSLFNDNYSEIKFGKGVIKMAKNINKSNEQISQYFMLSKHKTVEENILFSAKQLYVLLSDKPKHIDELLLEYSEVNNVTLNLNIERIAYLALTFLYSIGEIKMEGNMIVKSNEGKENDI